MIANFVNSLNGKNKLMGGRMRIAGRLIGVLCKQVTMDHMHSVSYIFVISPFGGHSSPYIASFGINSSFYLITNSSAFYHRKHDC